MAGIVPNRPTRLLLSYVILCVIGMCAAVSGQEADNLPTGEAVLSDEFTRVGDCEFGGRMDTFLAELSNKPEHQGYIINYKAADELPGDRDSFARDRMIANHLAFRNFDRSRITLIRGGYREEMSTELWIAPPGVQPPAPSRTVAEPVTPDKATFLFAKRYLYSDFEEDLLEEYVLQSVKDQEEADRVALEAEWKAEDEQNAEAEPTPEAEAEAESGTDTPEADEDPPFVDERTAEEKEDEKFSWANVAIARLIAERKTGTGVIIFYADDQRYDVAKLLTFIEQGRMRLAEHGPIKASLLRIEFGGYRHEPQVEFWFVPANGKPPQATPAERFVEEPDANHH